MAGIFAATLPAAPPGRPETSRSSADYPAPAQPATSGFSFAGGSASASGSAGGSSMATGNGTSGGQGMARAAANVQISGGLPAATTGSSQPSMNMPNLLNGVTLPALIPNATLPGIAAVANVPDVASGVQRRAVAHANGQDNITTGADEAYSAVIRTKPNGQITMILVNLTNLDVKRVQAANEVELMKKDAAAYEQFLKYKAE
ncbi:MAG: hypothetical protein QM811_07285 [Pirellulales bacterium]